MARPAHWPRTTSRGTLTQAVALALGACSVGACLVLSACSTIEPGGHPQIAQVVYDEDFFYCQVLPNVLVAKSCSSGDPAQDTGGGCHSSVTSFRILPIDAAMTVACDGNKRTGPVSNAAQSNYFTAQGQMTQDANTAPLLTRPTKKQNHPREIFNEKSPEADIIRRWAQLSSR